MADDDVDGYKEPTKVEVDPYKLKSEANDLPQWGTDALLKYNALKGMYFPVGAFPAANRLRDQIDSCVRQLATNTWNLGKMLQKTIPDNLIASADQYIRDEDDNEKDGGRAKSFATAVNKYGPGAENAAPATPGVPPPAQPQKVSEPPSPKGSN
jgi:hypothetical protein